MKLDSIVSVRKKNHAARHVFSEEVSPFPCRAALVTCFVSRRDTKWAMGGATWGAWGYQKPKGKGQAKDTGAVAQAPGVKPEATYAQAQAGPGAHTGGSAGVGWWFCFLGRLVRFVVYALRSPYLFGFIFMFGATRSGLLNKGWRTLKHMAICT
jgi:hypothetical protein